MNARIVIVAIVAPLIVCVAGAVIIELRFGDTGLAPIPFLVMAYVLGLVVWGPMQLVLPRSVCLRTAIGAAVIAIAAALTGSHGQQFLWAVGVPSVAGIAVTWPDAWLPGGETT